MRRAVCPGSFDPIHKGHLEIIARATNLFDEVVVAVSTNYAKKYMFTEADRVEMVRESVSGLAGIRIEAMGDGLLAGFCRQVGAEAIVKGLRSSLDYQYEVPMAAMNRHLTGVETVFLTAEHPVHAPVLHVVKEIQALGGDVSDFLPKAALRRLGAGR